MISLSTRAFSWNGVVGAAEASDLQMNSYPDQLLLESASSGSAVVFRREHQEVNEGDLLFTRYVSTRPVNGSQLCLIVFND